MDNDWLVILWLGNINVTSKLEDADGIKKGPDDLTPGPQIICLLLWRLPPVIYLLHLLTFVQIPDQARLER